MKHFSNVERVSLRQFVILLDAKLPGSAHHFQVMSQVTITTDGEVDSSDTDDETPSLLRTF